MEGKELPPPSGEWSWKAAVGEIQFLAGGIVRWFLEACTLYLPFACPEEFHQFVLWLPVHPPLYIQFPSTVKREKHYKPQSALRKPFAVLVDCTVPGCFALPLPAVFAAPKTDAPSQNRFALVKLFLRVISRKETQYRCVSQRLLLKAHLEESQSIQLIGW